MKLKHKIFKYTLSINLIIIIIISSLFLIFFISNLKRSTLNNIYLVNTSLNNSFEECFSYIEKTLKNILENNDTIFVFDNNPIISGYAKKTLNKKFNEIIDSKYCIENMSLIQNSKTIVGDYEENKTNFFIKNDTPYIQIEKVLQSDNNRKLLLLFNLKKFYENFINNLKDNKYYYLLIKTDNEFYNLNMNEMSKLENINNFLFLKDRFYSSSVTKNLEFNIIFSKNYINNLLFWIFFIFIFLFLFSILMLIIVSNKLSNNLVRSLNKFMVFSKSIGSRDFKQFIPNEDDEDEIKELSSAFNNMSKKIEIFTKNMEQLVAERTEEIEAQNEELETQNEELEKINKKLEETSVRDGLTGLYNRRYFNEKVEEDFELAKRNGMYFQMCIIDIDHFKNINDTYGHLIGDECIKSVTTILKENLKRYTDKAFRYGGEEFVFYDISNKNENFEKLLKKIRKEVEESKCIINELEIKVTISIGACIAKPKYEDIYEKFIKEADEALYDAKEKGRNRIILRKN
ncbi:hypothetical protein OSSY52_10090 [Tepiditoga spiralis]|uniref:GGDEF domain-containing protein n=1 Tax=Tepiditoga spiralis TaxID=2108365 RepID=A0A7G1G382_9BACT|nr:diguanylate cyclase [Tepiditoga spiralis]BBE30868.1 hypothetical protein OSSY52_10090 [Tepiditoga spiralis]